MAVEDAELKATCINFWISSVAVLLLVPILFLRLLIQMEMAAKVTEMAVVARVLHAA